MPASGKCSDFCNHEHVIQAKSQCDFSPKGELVSELHQKKSRQNSTMCLLVRNVMLGIHQ